MIDQQQAFALLFGGGPATTFLAIAFGVMTLSLVVSVLTRNRRRKRPAARNKTSDTDAGKWNLSDPKVQMEAVAEADFAPQPLLNKEESRLLPILDATIRDLDAGHRVIIQTSLAEVISASGASNDIRRRGHASINSKRLDFGVVDRAGLLKVAIEYQGSGHYDKRTFQRDAVKREALRKAGIPMMEVGKDFSPDQVRTELATHLSPQTARRPGRDGFNPGKRPA